MRTIILSIIITLAIFIPIFSKVNFIADFCLKKAYFCIEVYGIALLGGYITIDKNNLYIHIGKKKVILFDYAEAMKENKVKINVNAIDARTFNSVYRGSSDKICANIGIISVLHIVNNSICPIIKYYRPFIKIKNDLAICDIECSQFIGNFKIMFNMFAILMILIKKIIEKVINGKGKQYQ